MGSPGVLQEDEESPSTTRHTTHAGKQTGLEGLGYGFYVAWDHLRPFIPFLLISCMVVALVYLMQAIVFGGPFKDPLFFVKFEERWPRPAPNHPDPQGPTEANIPVPYSALEQVLFQLHRDNGTTGALEYSFYSWKSWI